MAFEFSKYGVSNPNTYGDHANLNASHNADLIYQNIIGRNMDSRGRSYWTDQISSKGEQGYQDMVNSLLASTEYKDRLAHKTANPNATEIDLDRLSSAYVSPFHSFSGSSVAGWTPGDPLTMAIANAVTSDTTNNAHANFGDHINKTVADVIGDSASTNRTLGGPFGVTGGIDTKVATNLDTGQWDKLHDTDPTILGSGAVDFPKTIGTTNTHTIGETLTNTDGGDVVIKDKDSDGNLEVVEVSKINGGDKNTITDGADKNTITINPNTGEIVATGGSDSSTNLPAGLTMDDLKAWWAGVDKSQFGGGSGTSMQDFMQFMMMMNMMGGGMGGGYGGSQYGYGGLNPGGVTQAFDYKDMANWMKDTFGSGSGGGTTASLNVGG